EPFGNTSFSGPASNNSYQYTGRENDGTGVYFYRARYYNPASGRFISEDPIGFEGGLNFYAYVDDSPANGIVPTGKENPISHFAESIWASCVYPSLTLELHDPFSDISDVLTDWGTQGKDANAANMHAMGGRKDDNHYQTCSQALDGAANFIANEMNSDKLGPA